MVSLLFLLSLILQLRVFYFCLLHASRSPWLEAMHSSYRHRIHLVSSLDVAAALVVSVLTLFPVSELVLVSHVVNNGCRGCAGALFRRAVYKIIAW